MITDNNRSFLKLLLRSPDIGDGWRQVSDVVWPLVSGFDKKELLELNEDEKRVRLSPDGLVVANYLV
jgi:hypothetical protein